MDRSWSWSSPVSGGSVEENRPVQSTQTPREKWLFPFLASINSSAIHYLRPGCCCCCYYSCKSRLHRYRQLCCKLISSLPTRQTLFGGGGGGGGLPHNNCSTALCFQLIWCPFYSSTSSSSSSSANAKKTTRSLASLFNLSTFA